MLTCATLMLAGCAGYQYHQDGMKLAAQGDHESALAKLKAASQLEPGNSEYRIDMLSETGRHATDLIARADDARQAGNAVEAANLYVRALRVDPASEKARRGLNSLELDVRNAKLVSDAEVLLRGGRIDAARDKVTTALTNDPSNAAAKQLAATISAQTEKTRETKAAQSAALTVMHKPVTLQFRDANLRMVFEALSRTTGLNVILDRDVRADLKTTIFVKDAAVEDTVDLILLQNQLEKRTLNANTLFVYPATAAKQKEYQDLQVRTFHVTNVDVKYLQTVLKTVLKVKDLTVDERSGTLVMRDTADTIAVASKIIAAHDVPEPEVMLEVEVLEISRARLSNLGIKLPESVTFSTPEASTIGALRALTRNDILVSNLSLGVNLKLEDTDSNLLASPRIRARNKEKARILIGDRVPIITNTVTPTQAGSGVVTGSVQYQDVGLKLEFEPQVYSDQEVGIRISLEVSNIVKEIPGPNGSLAYQIGTRNAQTVVRLRDGETQILGGLISSDDRNTSSRIPGLGHLPTVGKLFGNNSGTDAKTEIVLSITPRILRAPTTLDASLRTIFAGTEGGVRERALQLDPIGMVQSQSSGGTAAATPTTPTTSVRPGRLVLPPRPPVQPASAGDAPAPGAIATGAPAPAASAPTAEAPPAPTAEPKTAP
ncbi:MAG: secretin N-terminal domain-containing protein [Burkholderiales bacterium]